MEITKIKLQYEDDLESIKSDWVALQHGNDMTVYQTYEWNKLLFYEEKNARHFHFNSEMYIYIVRNENKIICILPLIVQYHSTKIGVIGREKGIYILGYGSYSDYLNAIYDKKADDEVFNSLLASVKADFKNISIYLSDIRIGSRFEVFLNNSKYEKYDEKVSVQVNRKNTLEEYNASLSKNSKQNLRTAINRIKKAGLNYRYEIKGLTDDNNLISNLIELHIKRMVEKNIDNTSIKKYIGSIIRIISIKNREKNNNIIVNSIKTMSNSFLLICYLDDTIAGYLYGLRDKDTVRIMQNCINDDYKFYSPMYRTAYDYIVSTYDDDCVKVVDFTRGDERYKYNLGGEEVKLLSFKI